MFVRQLIGREAGNIINMPYDAAQSCLAMGTVAAVTDEEVAAAGLESPEPVVANRPDELPRGFRVEVIPGGGFDLFDPGGVNISKDVDLPNLVAARDLAWSVMLPTEAAPEAVAADASALEGLKKAELQEIAEKAGLDIASDAKKADIIAALVAAGITVPPADDTEGADALDGAGEGAGGDSTVDTEAEDDSDGEAGGDSAKNDDGGQA